MFKNLRSIKSYMFPMMADEADAGGSGGAGTVTGADSGDAGTVVTDSVDKDVPGGNGDQKPADTDPQYILEIGEGADARKLTQEDIFAALDAVDNKKSWETKLHERGEQLNIVEKMLEENRMKAINPDVNPQQIPGQAQTEKPAVTGQQLQDMILERPDEAMSVIDNLIQSAVSTAVGNYWTQSEAKNSFMSAHSDYDQTVNGSEFRDFMATNPLAPYLNSVNAFYEFKLHQANQLVENASKDGFNKGEKTTLDNLKAKGNIRVLAGGGAGMSAVQTQSTKDMSPAERASAAIQFLEKVRNSGG